MLSSQTTLSPVSVPARTFSLRRLYLHPYVTTVFFEKVVHNGTSNRQPEIENMMQFCRDIVQYLQSFGRENG